MSTGYAELHAASFYSFGRGASHAHELLAAAAANGCRALALTDSNLCGALEFARLGESLGIQAITGAELSLADGSRLVLLARTRQGYANISRLLTLANAADRREPMLDPAHLPDHADGTILLTGGRGGQLASLLLSGRRRDAASILAGYMEWFGSDSVYVELQRNLLRGDTLRNRSLMAIADEAGARVIATNDVHYHEPGRYRLQHALTAARRNITIDQALPFINPNHHLCIKSPAQMQRLFRDRPDAIESTVSVAERCSFNLATDLGYTLPEPDLPDGFTAETYLRRICEEAAVRRYGSISQRVKERLEEELGLMRRHNLAGFLLLYREIVLLAQRIMQERGLSDPETPLEKRPPGRGRGSSVALLAGYLIGISHVDPLRWNLTLERFISDDMTTLPDIDLDFPRSLRDELIRRVHAHFGPQFAVLAGAVSTYSVRGIIQDLGKALGLPREDLRSLSRQIQSSDGALLRQEMQALPAFRDRLTAPGWRDLADLAPQLSGAPRALGQHVGGMILSDSPIPAMVPIRAGATEGRYIMDWNKDSVADAGFAKIDLLSLPVLDQLDEALDLAEAAGRARVDLAEIDPGDPDVYDMIGSGMSKGVFLLQSPAQLKMGQRLRPRNLRDLAYQVALIRPGVGVQGSAVSQFVERYRRRAPWNYDHPLEQRALERGFGIIIWQEQVVQLIMDVAGMTAAQADEIRRSFARPNSEHLVEGHRRRFIEGAIANGVPEQVAGEIFGKINGHYMFPESHSHAFAVTAYQAAWLKRHHPLEFFTALINNQPMGFYPAETLKEDARRFGVSFLNPCINRSGARCMPSDGSVLLGLELIRDVGTGSAGSIVAERERGGPYSGAGDLVLRTGLAPKAAESLVLAGAFDSTTPNRREAMWDAGLPVRPSRNGQRALPASMEGSIPPLADLTAYERMAGEYLTMGIYPRGHLMEFVRPTLPPHVLPAAAADGLADGEEVMVAGWPVARQHPRGRNGTVFVTIEDETGDVQLILWHRTFARHRSKLRSKVIRAAGHISRWDGTTSIVVSDIEAVDASVRMPAAHDWH